LGKALGYTSVLRKLEAYDNTIAINLNNYSDILQKICDTITTNKEELSILNHFEIKTAPYMRSQIAGDLGYFKHGTDLIESAIASIRGIVEIEQARSDRAWQEQENKSDRALQTRVTVIGVGLGVSGLAATASPYLGLAEKVIKSRGVRNEEEAHLPHIISPALLRLFNS
jgi:hypothetical protein